MDGDPHLWEKFTTVKKRDGTIVDFDTEKISEAIRKAILATRGSTENIDVKAMAEQVLKGIEGRYSGYKTPDVEGIQDLVERSLMEFGLYDVARAYILYRERHRELRESKQKEILKKVESGQVLVTKRDGKKEPFSKEKLSRYINRACRGYEGVVHADELVRQCELSVTDGMTSSDIAKLAIMASRAFIETDPTSYSVVTSRLFLSSLYKEALAEFSSDDAESVYVSSFAESIKMGVEQKTLAPEMLKFDLARVSAAIKTNRDELLTYRGLQTLYDRYFIRNKLNDQPIETPQFFWMRVAMGLSINEANKEETAIKFYELLSTIRFVSSTPTLFHSGLSVPQLSSCYLTTIDDDLGHIFKSIGDNAQLSKWSGGIGNDWSSLRATGALIKKVGVESQGVVPFLKIANDTTLAINRSGKRRGATCAYLETWHADIEDFIDLRKSTGDERRRTHDMDTANWIPDLFMKRVLADAEWTLFSPDETPELHHIYGRAFEEKYIQYEEKAKKGEVKLFKTMKAQALWRKMISSLFETSHPWMVFRDPANVRSPQDHVGVVHSSNLCTEITLNTSKDETAVCNLGSINLAKHVRNGKLDQEMIRETTMTAMRMLDNVIDICFYPTIEAKNSNWRHRPVGLGIMGYQDALYMLNINFDSQEAISFADESMEIISYYAILGSTELAKERGQYDSFKGSKWDRGLLPLDTLALLEKERGMEIDVDRSSKMDWTPVRESIKKNGMRNSNCMAIAPTATISNIADCFPSIEPIYKNLYVKSNMSGEFTVINKYMVEDLKKLGLWNRTLLEKMKEQDGSIKNIPLIPQKLRDKYKEAFDIEPEWLIRAAARRSKWIDQSQSLNIFTATSSGKRLSEIYTYAWKMGLKSTYYLRTMGATSVEKSTLEMSNKAPVSAPAVAQMATVQSKTETMVQPQMQSSPSIVEMVSVIDANQTKFSEPEMQVVKPVIETPMPQSVPQPDPEFMGKVCKVDGRTMSEDETCESCQ